jgi:hypothetical protein
MVVVVEEPGTLLLYNVTDRGRSRQRSSTELVISNTVWWGREQNSVLEGN